MEINRTYGYCSVILTLLYSSFLSVLTSLGEQTKQIVFSYCVAYVIKLCKQRNIMLFYKKLTIHYQDKP